MKSTKYWKEIAQCCAVIGRAMSQIESEKGIAPVNGLMSSYDRAVELAEEFVRMYPLNFDWEEFYDNGGEDWDILLMKFTREKYLP